MLFSSIIYGSQEAKRWDTTDLQLLFNLNRQRPSATRWLPFSRLRQFDVCLHEKGSAICPSRIT